jgi:hypothetical protein
VAEDSYDLRNFDEVCHKRIKKQKWKQRISDGVLNVDDLESVGQAKG